MRLTDERLWNSSCLWRTAKNICRASRVFTKFASEPNPDWCTGQPAEPIENPANADEIALATATENLLGTKIKKLKRKKKKSHCGSSFWQCFVNWWQEVDEYETLFKRKEIIQLATWADWWRATNQLCPNQPQLFNWKWQTETFSAWTNSSRVPEFQNFIFRFQFDRIKWFIRLETKSRRILPLSYATKYEMT